ncbi:lycopene cyclase family protein [Williamsia herbipolensis]|uniref:lycopene cyclase family protein n=1 Tax=Williamsia herbipolensis TaxID=1603258 RepID=UPI0005F85639|nr:lycopene cyclase family protein [Williamsia herbipolensis]
MADPRLRRHDLAVVGAAAAGRALAHRAARAGLDVALIDRAPHRPWRATYSAWTDELPTWLDPGAVEHAVPSIAVYSPGRHRIDRGYSVLSETFVDTLTLDGVTVVAGTAGHVAADRVELADGPPVVAATVVDARGAMSTAGPAQTAYGVFLPATAAEPLLDGDHAVLMDWRSEHGWAGGQPSFLYVVPVSAGRVLVEETCLAGDPAIGVGDLRTRLHRRLARSGVDVGRYESDDAIERVHFALTAGGARPWEHRPTTHGAAGGLMHPATGYSVATSLRWTDTVVEALVGGHDVGEALWPTGARGVHALRRRGLNALLQLDGPSTVAFFDAFFAMPPERQRAYLSGRDDLSGVMAAMMTMAWFARPRLGLRVARGATALPRW